MEINGVFILAVILVVIAFLFASQGIKVVPQQSAWVVERLGKFHAVLNPGLNFIIPCLLYTSPSPRDRSLSRMPSSA